MYSIHYHHITTIIGARNHIYLVSNALYKYQLVNLYDILSRQTDDVIAFLHASLLMSRVMARRLSAYETNLVRKLLMKSPEYLFTNNLADSILQAHVCHYIVLVFPCAIFRI